MPAENELQVLRIVQEALTNIRKHAHATTHPARRPCASADCLEVAVTDDGRGFEPVQSRPLGQPHFGLSTMRERAEAIGADVEHPVGAGQGTRVALRLPTAGA